MVFSRFARQLFWRLAVLFALLIALAVVIARPQFVAVAIVIGAAAVVQAWRVLRFVNRTNAELSRFLDAIRYDDFSPSFSMGGLGNTFADLEAAFEQVMSRFRDARLDGETQRCYLETLIEHVPIAILAVHDDGRVALLNNAARRLLDTPGETSLGALDRYGAAFQRDISQARSGERKLTRTELDGVERQLVVSTTQIAIGGQVERLISLQDIQHELDSTELTAWQDMVRVLSHEIGNSITPIASLARTTEEMVTDLEHKADDPEATAELIGDIRDAVTTITRRSEGLMRFVKSYRQLTRLPAPNKQKILLSDYFERLERLLAAEWGDQGVALRIATPSAGLTIVADESLLDQAILNIVRNAAQAAQTAEQPRVWLEARLSERGRPVIEIADNGSGIDDQLSEKIFLPFFTTKVDGSGVGLALARQVMLLHQGSIAARSRDGGGALFQLRF